MADDDTTSHPRNPPRPVTLAKDPLRPVTLSKVPPRPVTLAKGQQRPVTLSKAPLGKITLSTRPKGPVTLAKNPPGEVSKAKGAERPVTLPKSPPREATTAKGPDRAVTLAKSPERPVTLPSKPPREVTLAKGPQREVTLAKAPPREVTLAKGPERSVTLAKGPERPVTLAKGLERPVTLPKQPQRPVSVPTHPERPVTIARQQKPIIRRMAAPVKSKSKSRLLDSFTGPGSTPSRRRFWDKITQSVIASQKVAGKNVSVSEHQGMGTLINATRGRPPSGVCCDTETMTIVFTGIVDCLGVTGDLNGSFVLTETFPGSGVWSGAGAVYNVGFDVPTVITVQCGGTNFSIDYRDDLGGTQPIFVTGTIPIPPSFTDIPNNITDCDLSVAKNGTATITCGG